jgi:hypothetical protein
MGANDGFPSCGGGASVQVADNHRFPVLLPIEEEKRLVVSL